MNMKLATAAVSLLLSAPLHAQHVHHEGMVMPPVEAPKPARSETPPAPVPPQDPPAAEAAPAHDMSTHDMSQHDMSTHDMPMADMPMHGAHQMSGALGRYPMAREASGTAWQPDASEHGGLHAVRGDWMLMAHGTVNLVADHQSGPRGADATFVSGMLMGMARREVGAGTLQLRAMLSPDPFMGPRGYPLLLASGETADGTTRLVDRQHPHDAFMELSASVSRPFGASGSAFLYAGLPAEPAFGPPAFMHREAIADSPEAPITHHWLDSTHISMGVVTAGVIVDRVKVEASRFNAREPDQHRWNLEPGALDSSAVRLSWNPTDRVALQASWGDFQQPEPLEPGVDQRRLSASALYARPLASGARLAGTLAWGRKSIRHDGGWLDDDAFAAEASLARSGWTLFGRAELTENRELVDLDAGDDDAHGPAYRVGKASLGLVRDVRISPRLTFGAGGLVGVDVLPRALEAAYGSRHPMGAMLFLRVMLDGG